jgi:hypothetical protein
MAGCLSSRCLAVRCHVTLCCLMNTGVIVFRKVRRCLIPAKVYFAILLWIKVFLTVCRRTAFSCHWLGHLLWLLQTRLCSMRQDVTATYCHTAITLVFLLWHVPEANRPVTSHRILIYFKIFYSTEGYDIIDYEKFLLKLSTLSSTVNPLMCL